jgi:hypothetical protein
LALNTDLLHQWISNITRAARAVGLRAATLLDLCNGKTKIEHVEVGTLVRVAQIAHCTLDELVIASPPQEESFAATVARWGESTTGIRHSLGAPQVADPLSEGERLATIAALPAATVVNAGSPTPRGPYAI